jgi:hypothetical protein
MPNMELTLKERAGRMYRQLLVLQRLFQLSREPDDVDWIGSGDGEKDLALCAGLKEMIDDLTAHAEILASIPFPVSEWRPGDGPDDERWRALTEMERRAVLSMLSGYENLISWGERMDAWQQQREASDYLNAERVRIARFRQEMGFLEKRRLAG